MNGLDDALIPVKGWIDEFRDTQEALDRFIPSPRDTSAVLAKVCRSALSGSNILPASAMHHGRFWDIGESRNDEAVGQLLTSRARQLVVAIRDFPVDKAPELLKYLRLRTGEEM